MAESPCARIARLLLACGVAVALCGQSRADDPGAASRRAVAEAVREGNWAEALAMAKLRLATPDAAPADLRDAIACLTRLGRVDESDRLLERAVERHGDRTELLLAAEAAYGGLPAYGYEIGGEFRRGDHRGGGEAMSVVEADRVRRLRLLLRAHADEDAAPELRSEACQRLAAAIVDDRQGRRSWRLQSLTDLDALPAPQPARDVGWPGGWGGGQRMSDPPVDADGAPVLYESPDAWSEARNDGERWRWALREAVRRAGDAAPGVAAWADTTYADFLREQFGVQTLVRGGWFRPQNDADDAPDDLTSVAVLATLEDDETIARLANGVRRFRLPEGHRYVALYRRHRRWNPLANIRLDRGQRGRAAEALRSAIDDADDDDARERLRARVDQIVEPWVRFEPQRSQPAGGEVALRLKHRNTGRIALSARAIDVPRLLADAKAWLEDPPEDLANRDLQLERLGYRLIQERGERYLGEQVAAWRVDVPRGDDHADGETRAAAPFTKAGAYFVTARASDDGPPTSVVCWVADTVLARKPTRAGALYAVLDASDGYPIAGAELELFGYRTLRPRGEGNKAEVETTRRVGEVDKDGLVDVPLDDADGETPYNWLATATTDDGRLAFLGFQSMWARPEPSQPPRDTRTFVVTDRPVYRPGATVRFRAWIARPDYAVEPSEEASEFAHQAFRVELYDARGDKVATKSLTASPRGGLSGSFTPPADGPLGEHQIRVVGFGVGRFRVEEYRKPEFEVTVASPDRPTRLGDPVEATIRAEYYFGAPVAGARVAYRVERTARDARWIPPAEWDWLYGAGYAWLGQPAAWRSDWRNWGCVAPDPWRPWRPESPQLVAEGEATLDADGVFRVTVDTREAASRRPDVDHAYTLTAEVTDASRRTIVGSGAVLAARRPLVASLWLDRGHYEAGDTMTASVAVRTPDGQPVAQSGRLRLLRIEPTAAQPPPSGAPAPLPDPEETEVQDWELATGRDGSASLRLKASKPGRYRLLFETDPIGKGGAAVRVAAGAVFTIRGPGFDGDRFRYGAIEIVPDKSAYRPGETARLLINADRAGATVALFLRPAEGVYAAPRVFQLSGKSEVVEVTVAPGDAPNFFVETLTVADGRVHSAVRQIAVPPESRVLNVEAVPSNDVFQPGQRGGLRVRVTDAAGAPIVGEVTIAVYDRSVDAVAPDVAPGDIRKRFWNWRRRHSPTTTHNLARLELPVAKPGAPTMQPLGVFGHAGGGLGITSVDYFGGPVAVGAVAERAMSDATPAGAPKADAATAGVRTNFADTALWVGSVTTDEQGLAETPLTLPESLTAWRVRVWAVAGGARVGEGEAECVTRKDLMVRLMAPRFLVETDEAVVSALVRSDLAKAQTARVRLEVDAADGVAEIVSPAEQSVRVGPGEQRRVEWRVRADREAAAGLVASVVATPIDAAGGASESEANDAMRLDLPVVVHGAEIVESFSATIADDAHLATFEVEVPERRRPEATRLEVRYTPTLVGAMVEALPYLIQYPHGCTEQTLNRFLPAVVTRKTLADLGVDLAELAPDADDAPADGAPAVCDAGELDRLVKRGVRRLEEMQLSDGGWGWFSGFGERSSAHTTAVVVRGLLLARRSGVAVPDAAVDRGVAWLENHQAAELAKLANTADDGRPIDADRPHKAHADDLDALVHLVLAEAGRPSAELRDRLFADRLGLMPYSLAMLGVALDLESRAVDGGDGGAKAVVALRDRVVRNLMQFVVEDDENQTAYLNLPGGSWWRWYGSEFEAHAFFLKLLVATESRGELASRVVKHLLDSRRSARRWNGTRDTALVVEALAEYAVASGEGGAGDEADGPEPMTVEVWLDGQRRQAVALTPAEALRRPGRFVLTGDELAAGRHTLEVRKRGPGRLYAGATLASFSLEPDLRAAGLELRVERKLFRLVPIADADEAVDDRGGVVTIGVRKHRRVAIPNLGGVRSGELVEVELNLVSKNDYEYLVIEDPKPAGCEPIATRSGYNGNAIGAYAEFRDRLVRFYATRLARGEHTLRYRVRAETPGVFAALPTTVRAMYAPDLRGSSDELRLKIADRPDE